MCAKHLKQQLRRLVGSALMSRNHTPWQGSQNISWRAFQSPLPAALSLRAGSSRWTDLPISYCSVISTKPEEKFRFLPASRIEEQRGGPSARQLVVDGVYAFFSSPFLFNRLIVTCTDHNNHRSFHQHMLLCCIVIILSSIYYLLNPFFFKSCTHIKII